MSKKKAFSGSTMTLKDFHGGSIPSDLPLPSAPGVASKAVDRSVHERQSTGSSWGGSINRVYPTGDHRVRQGSANNTQRSFEDKVSYLPNSANIGRNFDEDERKPLDGFSRRTINDEDYSNQTYEERRTRQDRFGDRLAPNRSDIKSEPGVVSTGISYGVKPPARQNQYSASSQSDLGSHGNQDRGSNPSTHQQTSFGHQFAAPMQQQLKHSSSLSTSALNSARSIGGNSSMAAQPHGAGRPFVAASSAPSPAAPNAWMARREMESSRAEPVANDNISSSSWSAQSVASRFAQASAVDKVSSGRWQSKLSLGLEQQSERSGQFQHSNSFYDSRKVGLDSGNFSHGYSEAIVDGTQARNLNNVDQNTYNGKEKSNFVEYGANTTSYRESAKAYSLDVEKPHIGKDMSIETRRNFDVEATLRNKDESRSGFRETGGHYGDSAQVRLGPNSDYRGYGDASWKKIDGRADLDENDMATLGMAVSRQLSPVPDAVEGVKSNNLLEERGSLIDIGRGHSHQVDSGCALHNDGAMPLYNQENAHESWSAGSYRDCFPPEGVRSNLYSEVKEGSNATSSYDYELSGIKLATENTRASSPAGSSISLLAEGNRASATPTGSSAQMRSDVSSRPKLKLLPRTKPLETNQTAAWEHIESTRPGLPSRSNEYHSAASPLPVDFSSEGTGNNPHQIVKVLGGSDVEQEERPSERPKLNLRPRSVPVEQLEANIEKERKSLFGGARPRELVLKERGVDDMVISGLDPVPVVNRGNKLISKDADQLDELQVESGGGGNHFRQGEKVENTQVSTRLLERSDTSRSERRDSDKKDYWSDVEKQELQRNSRRNENWRNPHNKDIEKQERKHDLDKQDSWRRSADSQSSNSGPQRSLSSSLLDSPTHIPGKHGYGRTASAVELAQAFSRSVSVIGNGQRFLSQISPLPNRPAEGLGRGTNDISGGKGVPFTRLTDSSVAREVYSGSVQKQINGY
eukprot:Gb_22844 [translate_table: standard]